MSICPSIENFEGGLHHVELKVLRAIMKLERGPLVFATLVDLHDFGDPAKLGNTCVKQQSVHQCSAMGFILV